MVNEATPLNVEQRIDILRAAQMVVDAVTKSAERAREDIISTAHAAENVARQIAEDAALLSQEIGKHTDGLNARMTSFGKCMAEVSMGHQALKDRVLQLAEELAHPVEDQPKDHVAAAQKALRDVLVQA